MKCHQGVDAVLPKERPLEKPCFLCSGAAIVLFGPFPAYDPAQQHATAKRIWKREQFASFEGCPNRLPESTHIHPSPRKGLKSSIPFGYRSNKIGVWASPANISSTNSGPLPKLGTSHSLIRGIEMLFTLQRMDPREP